MRGRADRAGEIELQFGALAGELAQPAQRQLDVAGAEFDGVVEVAELAPVPHLDRAAVPALLPGRCARPRGCSRELPNGEVPAVPIHLLAALVPALLLGETLAQRLHQLFPAAQRLDVRFFLVGQIALGEFAQPFLGEFGLWVGRGLDPLEALPEHAVEAVEMALVLDQRGAATGNRNRRCRSAATRCCIASSRVRYSRSETGTLAARNSRKKEMNTASQLGYNVSSHVPLPHQSGKRGAHRTAMAEREACRQRAMEHDRITLRPQCGMVTDRGRAPSSRAPAGRGGPEGRG